MSTSGEAVQHDGPVPAAPKRVQRRRTRGSRLPAGVVVVTRPGRWGNWHVGPDAAERFEADMAARSAGESCSAEAVAYPSDSEIRRHLGGQDLACYCPPGVPCHADTLLRIANPPGAPVQLVLGITPST